MAHDPGSKNYGYAVIAFKARRGKKADTAVDLGFSIRSLGKIKSVVTTLKDASEAAKELTAYSEELEGLIRTWEPDVQIAERYMSRRMGGVTIELVNMTLGVIRHVGLQQGLPTKLVPASQWKNELKRREVDLKETYKSARAFKVSPHEVDAVMIALYGVFSLLGYKAYSVLDLEVFVNAVLWKIKQYKEKEGLV